MGDDRHSDVRKFHNNKGYASYLDSGQSGPDEAVMTRVQQYTQAICCHCYTE